MSYVTAINKVLDHEGGFVNHPADRGGPTNWGITQKVYERHVGRSVSVDEMARMPRTDALAIYKINYWDAIGGDKIKFYSVAFAIFDQAVNRGVSAAVKQAQRIAGVAADGVMGSRSIEAINKMGETDFISKYLAASLSAYEAIVSSDPSQAVFIKGWRNRVKSIGDYVSAFAGKPNTTVLLSSGVIMLAVGAFFILNLSRAKA